MNDSERETGVFRIDLCDIRLPKGGFCEEITPLRDNYGMPVIVIEEDDCFRLLDGCGRISGMTRYGAEDAQCICVSEADMADRAGGDDEEWNASMYAKYCPEFSYKRTTN